MWHYAAMNTPTFASTANELMNSVPGLAGFAPPIEPFIALAHVNVRPDEFAYLGMNATPGRNGLEGDLLVLTNSGTVIEVSFKLGTEQPGFPKYEVGPITMRRLRENVEHILVAARSDELQRNDEQLEAKSVILNMKDGSSVALPLSRVSDGAAFIAKLRKAIDFE